jgi:WD40 repeat protein
VATAVSRSSDIVVGRDALGNVFVTGDGNTVQVTLTVVAADARLRANDAALRDNPYRGLLAFRETDRELFFGREDLIRKLWTRLHAQQRAASPRLLPIVGASGSGKSSLVRAGLLPELVRQPMEAMRTPTVLVLRPGANPMQRLADVLATLATASPLPPLDAPDALHRLAVASRDRDRVIVFVDQLEELFTECTSEAARAAFLDALAHAAAQPDGVVSVIFAMRNDFAGALRAHDAFARALREHRFTVSQMAKPQLIEAIEKPAGVLGCPWPSGLVENLVLQCEGRLGALPLLQFALKRLWPAQVAGRLDQRWSSQLIEDFVVQVADELVDGGSAEEQTARERILRRAFVAMVQLGEGTADTRRVARLAEIIARGETEHDVRQALAPFVAPEARLLTASELDGEPTYELAHEALIGAWDRLRGWLGHVPNKVDAEAIRGALRFRRQLWLAAQAWRIEHGALLRPPELARAQALCRHEGDDLPPLVDDYVAASTDAWAAHDRWQRRVRLAGYAALATFVVLISALLVLERRASADKERQTEAVQREKSEVERQKAEVERSAKETKARLAASYLEQGRAWLMDDHPMRAIPFFIASREEASDDNPVLQMMFAEATRHMPMAVFGEHDATATPPTELQPEIGSMPHAAFSADGTRVVVATTASTARVWDLQANKPATSLLHHDNALLGIVLGGDGTRVTTMTGDGVVRVWDSQTERPVMLFPLFPGSASPKVVKRAAFNADGTRVITASTDNVVRIWDVQSAPPLAGLLVYKGPVVSVALTADGAHAAAVASDGTVREWDTRTGQPVMLPRKLGDFIGGAAFSADGMSIITSRSFVNTVQAWRLRTRAPVAAPLPPQGHIISAAFSADGREVATANTDGIARVWDALTGQPVSEPLEHPVGLTSVAFSPDGTRLVTTTSDGRTWLWHTQIKPEVRPIIPDGHVVSAAFNADETRVVTTNEDEAVRVWNARTGQLVSGPIHPQGVDIMAFNPSGTRVITVNEAGAAQLWDAQTGQAVGAAMKQGAKIQDADFSPDGTRVVTASTDGTARVWDAQTGSPIGEPLLHDDHKNESDRLLRAVFSAEGTRIVTVRDDGTTRVWDSQTTRPITKLLEHGSRVTGVMFVDGTRIVTADHDNTARVWETQTERPLTGPLTHKDRVVGATISADGTRVATASYDRTARVWDARTGQPLTGPLEHKERLTGVAFSPDGTRVVTTSWDRTARVWDARTGQPVTQPLVHGTWAINAVFSADGTRVITTSLAEAQIWDLPLDHGSLEDWRRRARCSPFALEHGVLVENHGTCP